MNKSLKVFVASAILLISSCSHKQMVSERMSVLATLKKERGCNQAQSKSSPAPESKIEAVQNTVEQKEEKAVVETAVQNSEVKAEVK